MSFLKSDVSLFPQEEWEGGSSLSLIERLCVFSFFVVCDCADAVEYQ